MASTEQKRRLDASPPAPRDPNPTRAAVFVPWQNRPAVRPTRSAEARLSEAIGLGQAIDLEIVASGVVPIVVPRPATLLGKGKVEELAGLIRAEDIGLVLVDATLTPVQQRNLERAWGAKVLDRTGLILEIFGQRAKTREGRLQVELAHLTWQKSRLVRSWTHLERQRGGFGFLGGPGETQIEADRRMIQERIFRINKDLDQVKRTRGLHRRGRERVPFPVVALVGYTNAGKSTLFNQMTQAGVLSADLLFATLDPTMRALTLPHGGKAVLSDTVGFVSELPTLLVAAFRATLEEVLTAEVILHVRDIALEDSEAQAQDVHQVLTSLGIDLAQDGRIVEVWNKADQLDPERRDALQNIAARREPAARPLLVSAVTGEGVSHLLAAIEERLAKGRDVMTLDLDPIDGAGLHWLYEIGEILERNDMGEAIRVTVRLPAKLRGEVERRFPQASFAEG